METSVSAVKGAGEAPNPAARAIVAFVTFAASAFLNAHRLSIPPHRCPRIRIVVCRRGLSRACRVDRDWGDWRGGRR